jgi:hypothetical protein
MVLLAEFYIRGQVGITKGGTIGSEPHSNGTDPQKQAAPCGGRLSELLGRRILRHPDIDHLRHRADELTHTRLVITDRTFTRRRSSRATVGQRTTKSVTHGLLGNSRPSSSRGRQAVSRSVQRRRPVQFCATADVLGEFLEGVFEAGGREDLEVLTGPDGPAIIG